MIWDRAGKGRIKYADGNVMTGREKVEMVDGVLGEAEKRNLEKILGTMNEGGSENDEE